MATDKIHFVGIGFQRCATSWLNFMLADHPQICKPNSGLHYFNHNYGKGKAWYLDRVKSYCKESHSQVCGEFSTTYSYPENYKNVAARLKNDFPDTLILASIRDPVERAYSDYLRSVRRGEVKNKGLRQAISTDYQIMERGYYFPVIKEFQENFGSDRVMVVVYDQIVQKPYAVLSSIFAFLGIDDKYRPQNMNERMGATYQPRMQGIELALNKCQHFGRQFFQNNELLLPLKAFAKKIVKKVRFLNTNETKRDIRYKQELRKIYKNDVKQVEHVTGHDLSAWLKQ